MSDDFADMIERAMRARDWTRYRLAKECREHVSEQTVYNLLAGKAVKASTLAVVFDVLGFRIVPPEQYDHRVVLDVPRPPRKTPSKEDAE